MEYRVIQRLKDAVHTIVDDHAIVRNKRPPMVRVIRATAGENKGSRTHKDNSDKLPFRYTLWPTGDELIVLIQSVYSKYTARK